MGILTPKKGKGDKKKTAAATPKGGTSKFLNKSVNASGFVKKTQPGSANRGS